MKAITLICLINITININFAQKFYKSKNNVSPIVNNNVYFGKRETSPVIKFDSLTRCAIEKFIIDRFNSYRKSIGSQPLIFDDGLKNMAYHHVVYQRLAKKQEHTESIDFTNFTEMCFQDRATILGGYDKYDNISEGLLSTLDNISVDNINNEKTPCIKDIVDKFFTPGRGYNTCEYHWNQIMEPQWNRIFIYYDFNWLGDMSDSKFTMVNVTIVFASYEK
jgi:hypothetical protein